MKNRINIFLIILVFLLINFIFNFQTFKDLINTQFFGKIYISDYTMSEYVLENLRLTSSKLFYPYQIDFSVFGTGPNIFILFYLLFRLLLNPTASMIMVGLSSFWISSFFMFYLLRKMKIEPWIALIVSLAFSYMPFLSYQIIAQFGYVMVYFFPILFLLAHSFITNKNKNTKFFIAVLFGIVLGSLFYTILYYFLMSVLAIFFYAIYYFFVNRKLLLAFLTSNSKFILIVGIILSLFIFPWIYQMRKIAMLDGTLNTSGFGGATVLSADLLNFITPSAYNPIYKFFVNFLTNRSLIFVKYAKFFFNSSDRFAYPGIIVLGVYLYIICFKKKFGANLWKRINPHLFVSIIFALITLGPFLKVANRWMIPLEEGLYLIIPLPFLLLHYLPEFNNIRAPQRFDPIFVFFALIVVAYVLNSIFIKFNKKVKTFFIIFLFFIFLFDQFYAIPPRTNATLPNYIYSYIKKDREKVTVMEIPFTVRDGMEYIGFVHAISPMKGMLTHGKPIIGGYLPRINSYIFEYYRQLPFSGYIAKIIDKGNYDPDKEKPKALNIFSYENSLELAKQEIEFLDIKYILLKNDEKYTENIKALIEKIGFIKKLKDGQYDLYERQIGNENFEMVNFGEVNSNLFTAGGFSSQEDGYRWAQGKLAKVFI
ncbi:MAG: hypothetical protein Q7J11_01150, partial [Candidatus Roizmanbacteria bacterium]|nr:hypothetical protein [Candidatus Roizmanbacteria bacterium]